MTNLSKWTKALLVSGTVVLLSHTAFGGRAVAAEGDWATKAAMPAARRGPTGESINGRFYVAGGSSGSVLATLWVYDPSTDSWSVLASMPTPRHFAGAGTIDGKLYVVGGWSGGQLTALEVYDPGTNTWAIKSPMPAPRQNVAVTAVGGKLYVFGGDSGGGGTNTVFSYDPVVNSWATKAPIPEVKNGAAAAALDGKIFVVGGSAGAELRVYDPAANTWSSKATLPVSGLSSSSVGVIGGKLYVVGGFRSGGRTSNVYEYTPVLDQWVERFPPSPPSGFSDAAHGVLDGKLYNAGGTVEGVGTTAAVNAYTPPTTAVFTVRKTFSDSSPLEVEVMLSCNTGLPLAQSAMISVSKPVIFVVASIPSFAGMNCEITEVVPNGYEVEYDNGMGDPGFTSCSFNEVTRGTCDITNTPAPVNVVVEKEWIFEGSSEPNGVDTNYKLTLFCEAEIVGGENPCTSNVDWCVSWQDDTPATFTAQVIPGYPFSNCWVVENMADTAIETENNCGKLQVSVGNGDSCTITNTVFFEGVPSLNHYGLALLALLMLGVGFIGSRRFV